MKDIIFIFNLQLLIIMITYAHASQEELEYSRIRQKNEKYSFQKVCLCTQAILKKSHIFFFKKIVAKFVNRTLDRITKSYFLSTCGDDIQFTPSRLTP